MRWQRNFAKNYRYYLAIIWNIPISLMVNIFCEISASKDPTFRRKSRLVKKFLIVFTINITEKFQKNRWSRSPKVESPLDVKLFLNTKKKVLLGRTSNQFEFLNISRFQIVLFFKKYFLVLEAHCSKPCSEVECPVGNSAACYLLSFCL